MKTSQFKEEQVIRVVRLVDAGTADAAGYP